MVLRVEYTVAWICATPIEVDAAKAALDRIHDRVSNNSGDCYLLGSVQGHNVVVAYPDPGMSEKVSAADVAGRLRLTFSSIKYNLMVGIGTGARESNTKNKIRHGDVVVGRPTRYSQSNIVFNADGEPVEVHSAQAEGDEPGLAPLLQMAVGKAETSTIFQESKLSQFISDIKRRDPSNLAHSDVAQKHSPTVHYGLVASYSRSPRQEETLQKLMKNRNILCFETEAFGVKDLTRYLVIRGIFDFALATQSSDSWQASAAVAAAAYAKEVLSFIPSVFKATDNTADTFPEAAPVLDAILLTRPDIDRKSLIALKGRRVDGTCEWLTKHRSYREWVADTDTALSLLWVNGGPGKGKTMIAIYLTEILQPAVDSQNGVLLYYCSIAFPSSIAPFSVHLHSSILSGTTASASPVPANG